MTTSSVDVELSPELLELGEVAGILRSEHNDDGQGGMVLGHRTDDETTLLVLDTDWFSDPLGAQGLGGAPGRVDALFNLFMAVGFLGVAEPSIGDGDRDGDGDDSGDDRQETPAAGENGNGKQDDSDAIRWYPILDPTSSTEGEIEDVDDDNQDAESRDAEGEKGAGSSKKSGIYLIHDRTGSGNQVDGAIDSVVGIGFRYPAEDGDSAGEDPPIFQLSALLPLFHIHRAAASNAEEEIPSLYTDFVAGGTDYPLTLKAKVSDANGRMESDGGFKIGSFEVTAMLSESPAMDFTFTGIELPNMPDPDFPGAENDGELDLNAFRTIPEHGEEWLEFVFDFLVAQLGESAQVMVANLKYLLGLPSSDDSSPQPEWDSPFRDQFIDHPEEAGKEWLYDIVSNSALLPQWLHGWFCLFKGIDVNDASIPQDETDSIILLEHPYSIKLNLPIAENDQKESILTPSFDIDFPPTPFTPISGFDDTGVIGIQLSAKTKIADINLSSGSFEIEELYIPSFEITLSVCNLDWGVESPPLFNFQNNEHPEQNIRFDTVEFGLNLSADGVEPRLEATGLVLGSDDLEGSDLVIHAIADALSQVYENYLPVDADDDVAEKIEVLQGYRHLLQVVTDLVEIEIDDEAGAENEDPFDRNVPIILNKLAGLVSGWVKEPGSILEWLQTRLDRLPIVLGDFLSYYYDGISVDEKLIRFEPYDSLAVAVGVKEGANDDELFGFWVEPAISVDWLALNLKGGVGVKIDSFTDPQFTLAARASADETLLTLPGASGPPELACGLIDNGSHFSLKLYPQGKDESSDSAEDGIEFLPTLTSGWLEQLALQLLLPVATSAVLNNESVQKILEKPFPGTEDEDEINLKELLIHALIVKETAGEEVDEEADTLQLNSFEQLKSVTPQSFLAAALEVLLSADEFTIFEGFALIREETLYGLRLQIPDLAVTKGGKESNSSEIKMQIGKWLSSGPDSESETGPKTIELTAEKPDAGSSDTGASDTKEPDENWIQMTGGVESVADVPGLSIFLLTTAGDFEPKIEFVSVGLDIRGGKGRPLFTKNGYTLQGLESRILFTWSEAHKTELFGAAIQLDEMGIPLGPKAGGDPQKKNPVAENLLASGGGDKGGAKSGDEQAVNPTFSAMVAYAGKVGDDDSLHGSLTGKIFSDIPSADGKMWIPVSRNFGPLHCRQIGLGFDSDKKLLGVGYDGGVALGPLNIDLDHLTINIPLTEPQNFSKYELGLAGLDVSYNGGPISISGGFLKIEDGDQVEYSGMALIKATEFTITGFGSYAVVEGEPSLFVFAILHKDLGGPAFFHVTGLAAGFGYNRRFILPPVEEVQTFPLVRGALEENYFDGSGPDQTIVGAMEKLHQYIPPSRGDYWFAAGIRFSSFEMIESFALLSVSFGHEVEIALLGMSKMTIPKGAKEGEALAYAELAIKAVIKPEEGMLAVEGRLTDESYIFSKDCHLTGGFAFYTWFSGTHAGDFVVTLGGYHPEFDKPSHYPTVPRLAVNWQVTSELSISAELYYALTPSCLMAGGKISAVYQAGPIKAWYKAYAHFLLSWKPFYYLVDMGIDIGVEANLRIPLGFCTISISINVHLSVELHIWGPEFAGKIEVDLSVTTITIHFGPDKTPPAALTAEEFANSFLPSPHEVVGAQINSGLIRQESHDDGTPLRVVNAHALAVTAQSLIPISHFDELALAPNDEHLSPADLDAHGIRSMGKTNLTSKFTVTIDPKPSALFSIDRGKFTDDLNTDALNTEAELSQALLDRFEKEGCALPPQPVIVAHEEGIFWTIKNATGDSTEQTPTYDIHQEDDTLNVYIANIRIRPVNSGVPEALWGIGEEGKVKLPDNPEAITIAACMGMRISFDPKPPQGALLPMAIEMFASDFIGKPIPWDESLTHADPLAGKDDDTIKTVMGTVMKPKATGARNNILAVLRRESPFDLNDVQLDRLVDAGESYFQADPTASRIGAEYHQ